MAFGRHYSGLVSLASIIEFGGGGCFFFLVVSYNHLSVALCPFLLFPICFCHSTSVYAQLV